MPWTRIDNWPAGLDGLKRVTSCKDLGEGAITLMSSSLRTTRTLPWCSVWRVMGLRRGLTGDSIDVKTPMMRDVDSLNVAASSAVALYATR